LRKTSTEVENAVGGDVPEGSDWESWTVMFNFISAIFVGKFEISGHATRTAFAKDRE
jgi:hypothetical protein